MHTHAHTYTHTHACVAQLLRRQTHTLYPELYIVIFCNALKRSCNPVVIL